MIAQNDSWRDLQTGAKTKPAKAPPPPAAAPLALAQPRVSGPLREGPDPIRRDAIGG